MLCKRRPSEVYIYQIKRVGNRRIEPGLLLYNYFGVFSGSLIKMKKLGRRRLRVSRGRTKMRNRSHSEILKIAPKQLIWNMANSCVLKPNISGATYQPLNCYYRCNNLVN